MFATRVNFRSHDLKSMKRCSAQT